MTRILLVILLPTAAFANGPGDLRALARSYYDWRDSTYPVFSSDQGKHTWDDRLTDYRMPAVRERRRHVDSVLARVKAMRTDGWSKDDRIDKILFEAQLEKDAFFPRVMRPEESDPQVYVNEASNGIFSLLRKEYAPKKQRYDPKSENFYIRAAIEDPRPILGHEGIPGHFLQISIANHLKYEIRRQHVDNTFVEGWALYGEEMLMREGLYADQSPSQGQVLRLSRYRAARIGVDVNLQTGRWTFSQAVDHFMEGGGLDREAATGEAAGAASNPSQKIGYMVGKWQIMRLLGRYRDAQGANFRLGEFHDRVISYGSLPLSVIEWLMFDDDMSLRKAGAH